MGKKVKRANLSVVSSTGEKYEMENLPLDNITLHPDGSLRVYLPTEDDYTSSIVGWSNPSHFELHRYEIEIEEI